MSEQEYRARKYYQDKQVASQYDEIRFKSFLGRFTHQRESKMLNYMIDKYFELPGKLIDLPCGTGRLLPCFLTKGFSIAAADISEEMLDLTKQRFKNNSMVECHICNGEDLPFEDNSFDYVTSFRLMCHLPDETRMKVLREFIRVCRKYLVINYHFETMAPLYLFNSVFRKNNVATYQLSEDVLRKQLSMIKNIELCEIKKLSWYERSSALVVLKKIE